MSPNGNQVPTMVFPMQMFDRKTGNWFVFFGQDQYDARDKNRYSDQREHVEPKRQDPRLSTKGS